MTQVPEGLGLTIQSLDIVFEADVQSGDALSEPGNGEPQWQRAQDVCMRRWTEPGRARFGPNATHVLQRRARLLTHDPGVQIRTHAEGDSDRDADARAGAL